MSYSPIEIEKAKELCPTFMELPIYQEAYEDSRCTVMLNNNGTPTLDILYRVEDMGGKYIGLWICFIGKAIYVYGAFEDSFGIRGGENIIDDLDTESHLADVVGKALSAMDICPVCGKSVPFKEQEGFSFAGRCCKDCLPKMKAIHEKPGWYN